MKTRVKRPVAFGESLRSLFLDLAACRIPDVSFCVSVFETLPALEVDVGFDTISQFGLLWFPLPAIVCFDPIQVFPSLPLMNSRP